MLNEKIEEMEEGKKYRKKELPEAVVENLGSLIEAGVIIRTGKKNGTRYERAPDPAWAQVAKDVLSGQQIDQVAAENNAEVAGESPATPMTQFSLAIGNRAALIVQMCDALQQGQAGLGTINDMKGQAILILRDLNLIEG